MDGSFPTVPAAIPPALSPQNKGLGILDCQTNRLDERVFRHHLQAAPFLSGVGRSRWRLVGVAWPHVVVAVRAADRSGSPAEYGFRFECTGYPQEPPMAQPWDMVANGPLLAQWWPTGRSRVPMAFRPDWAGGQGLYLPCDRSAIGSHPNWRTEHPHLVWSPDRDITQYLKVIYEHLNSQDYTGARSAWPLPVVPAKDMAGNDG